MGRRRVRKRQSRLHGRDLRVGRACSRLRSRPRVLGEPKDVRPGTKRSHPSRSGNNERVARRELFRILARSDDSHRLNRLAGPVEECPRHEQVTISLPLPRPVDMLAKLLTRYVVQRGEVDLEEDNVKRSIHSPQPNLLTPLTVAASARGDNREPLGERAEIEVVRPREVQVGQQQRRARPAELLAVPDRRGLASSPGGESTAGQAAMLPCKP